MPKNSPSVNQAPRVSVEDIWMGIGQKPRRIEVRAWWESQNAVQQAHAAQDRHTSNENETLLHWSIITDAAMTLNLLQAGADPNAQDKRGMTPLDWLTNQMFFIICDEKHRKPELKQEILELSTMSGVSVINHGGKASNPLPVWTTATCWSLVESWVRQYPDAKQTIAPDDFTLWHYWPVSLFNNAYARHQWGERLLTMKLNINQPNNKGITPWYVAVEAWLGSNSDTQILIDMIKMGADPYATPLATTHFEALKKTMTPLQRSTLELILAQAPLAMPTNR